MSHRLIHSFIARVLIALCFILSIGNGGFAADPAQERAESFKYFVENGVEANYLTRSLREKIISSRMFVLSLQDLLPTKGNPYYHMTDFALNSTLLAYKAAQKSTDSAMSEMVWLPVADPKNITAKEVADQNLVAPVLTYFAQYAGTVEIMENQIQPVLAKSIIITPLAETLGENKSKFDQAWEFTKFTAKKYKEFLSQSSTSEILSRQKKKATLLIISSISKGMVNYVDYIADNSNKVALAEFIETLSALGKLEPTDENISSAKEKIMSLVTSDNFKVVKKALDSVDLPDTGDIDGAEEAFEIAMRLEVGFDVLKNLFNHINETW